MAQDEWLTDEEERAWRAFQRLRTLLPARIFRDLLDDSGLSEPDYDVLSNLSETPERQRRLRDLAEHMVWSRSRLSHHIDRMQKRGLVARAPDPDDARGCVIVLTPTGLDAVERAAPAHVRSVRRHLFEVLDRRQVVAVADLSELIVEHLGDPSGPQGQRRR